MGAQVPSGHRSALTEPAGETVPPEAAEGVILGVARRGRGEGGEGREEIRSKV